MSIRNAVAVIAVSDFDAAADWYENLFDRIADLTPMDGLNEWYFPDGGGLMLTLDAEKSGSTGATLTVEDLDEKRAELSSRGIETSEPFGTPGVSYGATITDPAGNTLALFQITPPEQQV